MEVGLSLFVYSQADHKLRLASRKRRQRFLTNCEGPLKNRPFVGVFQLFRGLDILLLHQNGQAVHRQLLNLRPAQLQVISLLDPQA